MSIADEIMVTEERQRGRARRALRPWLLEDIAALKAIFDKRRYQSLAAATWTQGTAAKMRLQIQQDATWRAFQKETKPHLEAVVVDQLTKALHMGALDTQEATVAQCSKIKGLSCDWALPREFLAKVGRGLVHGATHREHAEAIWRDLNGTLTMALRQVGLRSSSEQVARSEFNRRADGALERAVTTLEDLVQDAVWMGHRQALSLLEAPRLLVEAA